MEERAESLSTAEYRTVAEALLKLVQEYPRQLGDPDVKAEYDALGADKSLAVFVAGGRYKKKYVSGSFTAEVNFSIAYKSQPRTSGQRIDRQEFVGGIVQWLEHTKDFPLLTGNRTITKITAVGMPYKSDADNKGNETYAADAVMEYMKKGD